MPDAVVRRKERRGYSDGLNALSCFGRGEKEEAIPSALIWGESGRRTESFAGIGETPFP